MSNINPLNTEQFNAVYSRDGSILVSAPAGSGKTKILVSRILSLLEDDFYHIDQLLVLTFTNAAALEMKQRLEKELDKRLETNISKESKEHLVLQKQKLPMAYITNFHGFCSTLLKQYGYIIGIASTFEIVSDATLIKHQIVDTCITKWLQREEFTTFISLYFSEYHFRNFKNMIFKFLNLKNTIYDFDQYMDKMKENIYQPVIEESLEQYMLTTTIFSILTNRAIEAKNKVIELRNFCNKNGLTFFYQNPYNDEKRSVLKTPYDCYLAYFTTILQTLETKDFTTLVKQGLPTLEKSYTIKWDEESKPYQSEYNSIKTAINKYYSSKFEDIVYQDTKEFKRIMETSYQAIHYLYQLMEEFDQEYVTYKQLHNLLDFNDLESYTLSLLDTKYPVVDTLYHQLKEIMIDEYQDTNQIQETLIMKIARNKEPMIPCFMVGDMKQSIYRFREADPQIFNQKYLSYGLDKETILQTKTRRIDLQYNYRSNKIVLDSVNYIFNQIMDKEIGGLEYYNDDSAKLNYDYLRKEGCLNLEEFEEIKNSAIERLHKETRFTTELLLTNKSKTLPSSEYEAMMVAKRISELVGHLSLHEYDQTKDIVEYKDIVVLMRNATEFITFKKVFDRFHIPCNIVLSQGFLDANEIIDSIYVLKALDNHLDDIAFTSLLTGNYIISHFDQSFLLRIKNTECYCIYDQLQYYLQHEGINDSKAHSFMEYYHELVEYSKNHTVKQTLERFYQDSQYPIFVSALINGKQRLSNLELLIEKLKEMEDLDLHSVVTKFSLQMENNVNMSPGQVLSNNDNVVSFMTIHKSKGLEFPIVFVSQMHKQFNKQDSRERLISDKNLGIALKPRVLKDLGQYHKQVVEYENKYRNLLASFQTKEMLNEEMRIFYVALTRASKKLICTGVIENPEVFIKWQDAICNNEEEDMIRDTKDTTILYRNIRNVNSYLDWMGLTIIRHPDFIRKCKEKNWTHDIDDDTIMILKQNSDKLAIYQNKNNHFDNTRHAKFDIQYIDHSKMDTFIIEHPNTISNYNPSTRTRYASYQYPYANSLKKSIAVTKKIEDGDREFIRADYDENDSSIFSANDRGTIIHSVLEHLPIIKNIDGKQVLQDLCRSGLYSTQQVALIKDYQEHLIDFINSDIYQLMVNSTVYKEKSFSFIDDNKQIIHGIFDVICIHNNTVTIIDYKTDRVKKDSEEDILIALHKPQMEYYIKVLKKVFSSYHIEAIVYYLYCNRYVKID